MDPSEESPAGLKPLVPVPSLFAEYGVWLASMFADCDDEIPGQHCFLVECNTKSFDVSVSATVAEGRSTLSSFVLIFSL